MGMDKRIPELLRAFGESGCPLCRRSAQHAARYLRNLLSEYVDDLPTRRSLRRSLGLCAEHAWALQGVALSLKGSGSLATAVLYEDVTRHVLAALSEYLTQGAAPPPRSGIRRVRHWLERRGRWGRCLAARLPSDEATPGGDLLAGLTPREPCPACAHVEAQVSGDISVLLRTLTDADFRAAYGASDGLCLPHLRQALSLAGNTGAAQILAEVAADRLRLLHFDLEEHWRKSDWSYREQARHPWEQAARVRAIAFFGGEASEQDTEAALAQRRWARAEYHRHLRGQAGATRPPAGEIFGRPGLDLESPTFDPGEPRTREAATGLDPEGTADPCDECEAQRPD